MQRHPLTRGRFTEELEKLGCPPEALQLVVQCADAFPNKEYLPTFGYVRLIRKWFYEWFGGEPEK